MASTVPTPIIIPITVSKVCRRFLRSDRNAIKELF